MRLHPPHRVDQPSHPRKQTLLAPLELEAGNIVWTITRLRGHLWFTEFRISSNHKALENIVKVGEHNARVQRWVDFLAAYSYT